MHDKACQGYSIRAPKNVAETDEDVSDLSVDVGAGKLGQVVGRVQLPFGNRGYSVSNAHVVLGVELRVTHDEHGYPFVVNGGPRWDDWSTAYQLTILAVSGLVCLTALTPPLISTSLLIPSTCVLLTNTLPFSI